MSTTETQLREALSARADAIDVRAIEAGEIRRRGTRRRAATRGTAGLASLVLVLAAVAAITRDVATRVPGVEIFADAAAALERDATARFELTSTAPGVSAKVHGVIDLHNRVIRATFQTQLRDFGSQAGEAFPQQEYVLIGDTAYYRVPAAMTDGSEDVWVIFEVPEDAGTGPSPLGFSATAADAAALLQRLEEVGDLIDLGPSEVRGARAHGYRLEGSAVTIMALSTGLPADEIEAGLRGADDSEILDDARGHIDVWIDDADRLRRLTTTLPGFATINDSLEIEGESITDIVFFDWGIPVDATPPEPVVTQEEMSERFGPGPDADAPAEQGPRPDGVPEAFPGDIPFPVMVQDLDVHVTDAESASIHFTTVADDPDHGSRTIELYVHALEATGWEGRGMSGGGRGFGHREIDNTYVRGDRQLQVTIVAERNEASVRLIISPSQRLPVGRETVGVTPAP